MAKYVLEILDGDRAGEVLSVSDQPVRVGRKTVNDLVLADEKTSGVHCEIVLEGDRHVLRDLGSTNGTFLDGRRVTEVVLTGGDVITVGRIRVKFRDENGTAAEGADFAVHRLDASKLPRKGSSALLLVVVVLVLAAGGGFYWWQNQQQGDAGSGTEQAAKASLVVPGNKLRAAVAGCEDPEGWNLAAAGCGFSASVERHSGSGAFEAARPAEGGSSDFAVAGLLEPISVFSGRPLVLAAHVRTFGSARIGVRGVCSSSDENNVRTLRHGTPLGGAEDWQRISVELAVPPGFDRLDVELVALLPDRDAVAMIDDVAVTEGGGAAALEHPMAEGGQRVEGMGTALVIHSTEETLLGLGPAEVPAAFQGLVDAGLGALSDLGAALTITPTERSVELVVEGSTSFELRFPAEAAGQTMVRAEPDGFFVPVSASSTNSVTDLLLGRQTTRVMLHFAEPVLCKGSVGSGLFRLQVDASRAALVLGFRADRQRAVELFGQATAAEAQGRSGDALDALRLLERTAPQDPETLAQATELRAKILGRLDEALATLERELAQARYFDTRGGFVRVRDGVEQLIAEYGRQNMEGREFEALATAASARLAELDATKEAAMTERLTLLSAAFREAKLAGLAALVDDYQRRHGGQQGAGEQGRQEPGK